MGSWSRLWLLDVFSKVLWKKNRVRINTFQTLSCKWTPKSNYCLSKTYLRHTARNTKCITRKYNPQSYSTDPVPRCRPTEIFRLYQRWAEPSDIYARVMKSLSNCVTFALWNNMAVGERWLLGFQTLLTSVSSVVNEMNTINPLANPKGVKLLCELCQKPAFNQCPDCRVTYYW